MDLNKKLAKTLGAKDALKAELISALKKESVSLNSIGDVERSMGEPTAEEQQDTQERSQGWAEADSVRSEVAGMTSQELLAELKMMIQQRYSLHPRIFDYTLQKNFESVGAKLGIYPVSTKNFEQVLGSMAERNIDSVQLMRDTVATIKIQLG